MSSRNVYLSDAERMQALALSRGLSEAHGLFAGGQTSAAAIRSRIREVLASAKIDPIDYVALVDPENLTEVDEVDESTIALIAVHVGKTRLIDNHVLGERWAG
jgi:pantoate--beta-alanine ligase